MKTDAVEYHGVALRYDKYYTEAREWTEAAIEADGWASVFEEIKPPGAFEYHEPFMDIVEEKAGKKIRTPEDLSAVTGLKNTEELQLLLSEAGERRYGRAITTALEDGATLKEILEIDPGALGYCGPDSLETVGERIGIWAGLEGCFLTDPPIRNLSEALEAPYMELLKILNKTRFFSLVA